eukprot:GDKJ01028428.1.p1 GENE.GDKJ01028428.1~~GDKJ01028428.1.p1  ORF type:complete len:1153 (-),score=277.95 GDKJ01028428.1:2200-5412(-)
MDTYGSSSTLLKFTKAISWVTLKPFQKAAVHWMDVIYSAEVNGVLSDEAGLGKSAIVGTYASVLIQARKKPVVILVHTDDLVQWAADLALSSPELKVSHNLTSVNDADVYLADINSLASSKSIQAVSPACLFVVGNETDPENSHTDLLMKRKVFSNVSCPKFFLLPALPATLRVHLLPCLTAPATVSESSLKQFLSSSNFLSEVDIYSQAVAPFILQRSASEVVSAALPSVSGIYRTNTMTRSLQLSSTDLDQLPNDHSMNYGDPFRMAGSVKPRQGEKMGSVFRLDEKLSVQNLNRSKMNLSQQGGAAAAKPTYTEEEELEIQKKLVSEEDDSLMEKYKSGSLRRLLGEAYPYRVLMAVGVCALVLASCSQLIVNLFVGRLVDELNKDDQDMQIWNVLTLFLVNAGVLAVTNFTWMFILWNTGDKIVCAMRKRLFWSIINREIAFFDKERTGALMSRLAGDVSLVKVALTVNLCDFIQKFVTVVAALAYMFYLSWSLTLIAASIAPVIGVVGSKLARYFHSIAKKSNDILAYANTHAEEAFSSAKTVRSFGQEQSIYKSYGSLCNKTLEIQMKSNLAKSFQRSFVYTFAMCAVTMALWYGSEEVKRGNMTSGDLLTFLLFGVQVGEKTGECLDNLSQIKGAAGASAKVFMYLDRGVDHLKNVALHTKRLAASAFERMDEEGNLITTSPTAALSTAIQSDLADSAMNGPITIGKDGRPDSYMMMSERNSLDSSEEGVKDEHEDLYSYKLDLVRRFKAGQKLTLEELAHTPEVLMNGELIELPPEAILARNELRKRDLAYRRRPKYPIVFENIWFRYPLRPDRDVLRGLNLKLEPGKVVALVGPSGGGKSTIVGLLERFYYAYRGRVSWGGVDLMEMDGTWLHRQIGYVGQEPTLLGGTVRDNILFGIRGVESFDEIPESEKAFWTEKVIAAAKAANAHNFIMSWPNGYETLVGERGTQVSGGQKQRIAIARAMIIDPPILLLDEATSALDSESEMLVQAALERLMEGRTTMMVAHRLSTVRNADVVVCLNGGVVAESGTHDELVALGGIYANLVTPQLQEAERKAIGGMH